MSGSNTPVFIECPQCQLWRQLGLTPCAIRLGGLQRRVAQVGENHHGPMCPRVRTPWGPGGWRTMEKSAAGKNDSCQLVVP